MAARRGQIGIRQCALAPHRLSTKQFFTDRVGVGCCASTKFN
jgi:hypothetical protein